jgi:hypothetical protein
VPSDLFCAACGATLRVQPPDLTTTGGAPSALSVEEKLMQLAEEREERRAAIRERYRASRRYRGSIGLALLEYLDSPVTRTLAVVTAIGVPVSLIALSPAFSNGQLIGLGLIAALFSLFIPTSSIGAWRDNSSDEPNAPRRPPARPGRDRE